MIQSFAGVVWRCVQGLGFRILDFGSGLGFRGLKKFGVYRSRMVHCRDRLLLRTDVGFGFRAYAFRADQQAEAGQRVCHCQRGSFGPE